MSLGRGDPKDESNNNPVSERLFWSCFPNEAPEPATRGTAQVTWLEDGTADSNPRWPSHFSCCP